MRSHLRVRARNGARSLNRPSRDGAPRGRVAAGMQRDCQIARGIGRALQGVDFGDDIVTVREAAGSLGRRQCHLTGARRSPAVASLEAANGAGAWTGSGSPGRVKTRPQARPTLRRIVELEAPMISWLRTTPRESKETAVRAGGPVRSDRSCRGAPCSSDRGGGRPRHGSSGLGAERP